MASMVKRTPKSQKLYRWRITRIRSSPAVAQRAFHIPLIEPGLVDLPHPALGQDLTPSPTARRAQAGTGVRA